MGILTAPRLELTVDIVTRLKNIFTRNNLLTFDSKNNTVCYLNGVTIEAFPSNLGIRSLRGYSDLVMITCDEASWFNINQNQEVIDTIERYYSKSNPIIVLCSTPQKIGDLMYNIKQQPEHERFYRLMELPYQVGLNKIYTEQEIAIQRKSLSFPREMECSFESSIDALFNSYSIDQCIADKYDTTFYQGLTCWGGCDPGFSTSKFATVVIAWANGKLQVMHEEEVEYANPDIMRSRLHSIIQEWNLCRLFIDSSSIFLIRQLCSDYGIPDVTLWDDKTKDQLLQTNSCGGANLIQSVNFRTKAGPMLELLHKVISTQQIRIDPQFKGIISSLRTASTKQFGGLYQLDKQATSSDDLLDALRMSLLCLGL